VCCIAKKQHPTAQGRGREREREREEREREREREREGERGRESERGRVIVDGSRWISMDLDGSLGSGFGIHSLGDTHSIAVAFDD